MFICYVNKFPFLTLFLFKTSSSDLLKIIIAIYPVYTSINFSPLQYSKCIFPIDLIKTSVLIEIFSCYLFNSISFCWSSDSINKLIVFISPCHVIFYKTLLKILRRYRVDFFLFLCLYIYRLLFLVHLSISRSCFQKLGCLVILSPLLSLCLMNFSFLLR